MKTSILTGDCCYYSDNAENKAVSTLNQLPYNGMQCIAAKSMLRPTERIGFCNTHKTKLLSEPAVWNELPL